MGLTYERSEIIVLNDPDSAQSLTIDPTQAPDALELFSGSRVILLSTANATDIERLREQLAEAHALESGPVEERVGWTAREFAEDDAYATTYIEGEVDSEGTVIEGTLTIGGRTAAGMVGSLNDLSLGLALGLHDELANYLTT